ncbi:DUF547 domain-containing protein [Tropicibacter sp. Alg240-R139]|uniref:DUF547 domain-containing protein n=1 Tax=Tropicibacter sp. Alg240-R139 TaxID=2305991 RepID=UPI001F076C2A|nr:DUF547 domain-containing protein [Tropicibacter sp. Alg240-R139]
MRLRTLAVLTVVALLSACTAIERAAVPKADPRADVFPTQFAQPPGQAVDHRPWSTFLSRFVRRDADDVNRVDYATVSKSDRETLDRYLATLQQVRPHRLTREQQLAFWINLYNALTVDQVLDAYPVASIRDINDGLLSIGPWDRPVAQVAGQSLSLNDIEHRIIRPDYAEPRIHYALNCAAVGCPNLMPRAWQAATLDVDLAEAEHAYVHDRRGVRFDGQGRLIVSKTYAWFREDFADTPAGVLDYLRSVADPELKARLDAVSRISRYDYDWALNDRSLRQK